MQLGTSDTGASNVIGVVLLIAISLVGVTTVGALGSQALDDVNQETQLRQAENAFSQLDSSASAVSFGPPNAERTVNLGLNAHRNAEVKTVQSGRVTIETTDTETGSTSVILDKQLNTIRYEGKNRVIDYQAGGVWRSDRGGGNSVMVTPPEINYDGRTLTVPIVLVSASDSSASKSSVTLSKTGSGSSTVESGRLENKTVSITVQSQHYQAWESYFDNRVEGETDITVDDSNQAVTVEFKPPQSSDQTRLTEAITSYNDIQIGGGSTINGDVLAGSEINERGSGTVTGETYENSAVLADSADALVDQKISQASSSPSAITIDSSTAPSEFQGGETYYSSGDLTLSDNDFDTSDGDITLVVDGSLTLQGSGTSEITGVCDGTYADDGECTDDEKKGVEVYVGDDFNQKNDHTVDIIGDHYQSFIIIGKSDMQGKLQGTFEGIIYAPGDTQQSTGNSNSNSNGNGNGNGGGNGGGGGGGVACGEATTCMVGGADFTGSAIGERVVVNGNSEVTYPSSLADNPLEINGGGTTNDSVVSYVHVTTTQIDVNT